MPSPEERGLVIEHLKSHDIPAMIYYKIPLHLQKVFSDLEYRKGDFPIAEKMANTSLSLPVHEFIKESDIKLMAKLIHKFYQK